jgi:hypothetical protein
MSESACSTSDRAAEHEIEIEILEARRARGFGGAQRRVAPVDAPERLQFFILEALNADGQAIDPGFPETPEVFLVHRAGIGLEGDLDILVERQARANPGQQTVNGLGREQARRAAADENRMHDPPPHARQVLLQVAQQRVDVFLLRNLFPRLVRIEIAIRALAHAPGDVHVERQRRKRGKLQHGQTGTKREGTTIIQFCRVC